MNEASLIITMLGSVISCLVAWGCYSLRTPTPANKRKMLLERTEADLIEAELQLESTQAHVQMLRMRLGRLRKEQQPATGEAFLAT